MRYQDLVYGQIEISEPVILELINSRALTRLKGIYQGGYAPLLVEADLALIKHDNRFAHSLGVYSLLNKFGAALEEQIAGLIHDASHSAFSHVIDYILEGGDGKNQSHQDKSHENFVKKSDLPEIIEKYGFGLDYILNDDNFPLKEKNIPDLCADRIDYALRDGIIFEESSREEIARILNDLTVDNNNWIFKNLTSAKNFTDLFFKLNTKYYASESDAIMFLAVSDFLKHALNKGYIGHGDLYTTDDEVINKIKQFLNQDEKLKLLWRRMNDKNSISVNSNNYDAEIFCKSRIVDPLFKDGTAIKRLSEAETGWGETVKQELQPKRYFLKYNY